MRIGRIDGDEAQTEGLDDVPDSRRTDDEGGGQGQRGDRGEGRGGDRGEGNRGPYPGTGVRIPS